MNRNEFIARLKENEIPPEIVSFDSSTNDGYNIRKNQLCWEVFSGKGEKNMAASVFPLKAMLCNTYTKSFTTYM